MARNYRKCMRKYLHRGYFIHFPPPKRLHSNLRNTILIVQNKSPSLYLEDDTARLQAHYSMPYVLDNIHSILPVGLTKHNAFQHLASIIVRIDTHLSRRMTKLSSLVGCRCIETTMTGFKTLSRQWHLYSRIG